MLKPNTKAKGKRSLISNETYQSYLLRFWRDSPHSAWRATLQSTANNDKFIFIQCSDLFHFLEARLMTTDAEDAHTAPGAPELMVQTDNEENYPA